MDKGYEYTGRERHKFWNLCPIQLCLSNELCSNQRIHAPNANNFGLGRQRVLQTDWFSTLHYSIPLIKRVRKLQSVIIWKAFEEQKFGHLLIGDKLNLAVEVLDGIPEKSASDSAWDLVVGCNIDRILFTILLIRLCGVCLWPGELGASSLTKGFWAVRIRNSWQAKRGEGMHGFYHHLRYN